MVVLEMLREWKIVIISVSQGYESMESWHNYRTETKITYRGRRALMDIRKAQDNFDKDGRLKCLNYNTYKHIAKECQRLKKKRKTRKYYKYNKVEHLAKDCRIGQKMENRSIQEDLDEKK